MKSQFKKLFDHTDFDTANLRIKDRSLVEKASLYSSSSRLSPENSVWIDKVFSACSRERKQDFGHFYAFKKIEHGLEIITGQKLKLFSLNDQSDNDFAELTEFYHRYTSISELSSSFQANLHKKSRGEIFIFCFTKSFRNEKFWKEYTAGSSGICIGFKFNSFGRTVENPSYEYEFRDIFYDNGYSFDFLNEIQAKVWRRLSVIYQIQPIYTTWFPHFYKRKKYAWEDESRISINKASFTSYENHNGKIIENCLIQIQETQNKKSFIELPFQNQYFSVSVKEVIVGKAVPEETFVHIQRLGQQFGFDVWRAVV